MKILIADRLLKGRPNADWKEGWEFFYAFQKLGIDADIAGPDCPIAETYIPDISKDYDLILITENYWTSGKPNSWRWWSWETISTPKVFWAVDTHLVDYSAWTQAAKIDYVVCNNRADLLKFSQPTFWLPYGISRKHYETRLMSQKKYDVMFIGNMKTDERSRIVRQVGATHLTAFGRDYIQEMQASRICLNIPISYDLNAKPLEIMASGAFLLCKDIPGLRELIDRDFLRSMLWTTEEELRSKIAYYLSNEDEREQLAQQARTYIFGNHTYENRAEAILNFVNQA